MNENIDLTKILKDCPIGRKFYSSIYGEVEFIGISYANPVPLHGHYDERYCPDIERQRYPIRIKAGIVEYNVSRKGRHKYGVGECTLFPSKKQRDWSKFTAPWYKKERFDPNTLKPFDKVLVRNDSREIEKYSEDAGLNRLNTYKEFVHYLHDKSIGNKDSLIECFEDNDINIFVGYKPVTKKLIDGKLYLEFEVDDTKYNSEWLASDNYAVWQTCGICGDDYSGYLLFPTYKDNEYFVLWYRC